MTKHMAQHVSAVENVTTARPRPSETFYVKESTKNRAKGRAREITGKVKSKAGRATGNPRLQDQGDAENISGKVQRKVGEAGKVFGR
jgi:uncharacterized protein YjbJ (UPF0337 family)